jgi:hypothetical protein
MTRLKHKCLLSVKQLTYRQRQTETESERMKNDTQANGIWKEAETAILIFDKADTKPKLVRKMKRYENVSTKCTSNTHLKSFF